MEAIALATLKSEVNAAVDLVGGLGESIAPEYKPLIALGKIAAKAFPDLLQDIENLLSGKDPSQADNDALAVKIHALANPETL